MPENDQPATAPQGPVAGGQEPADKSQEQAVNPWQLAEEGWDELGRAAAKIQAAANVIKRTERSVEGYNIERSLNKHKPQLMAEHLANLRAHRKANQL